MKFLTGKGKTERAIRVAAKHGAILVCANHRRVLEAKFRIQVLGLSVEVMTIKEFRTKNVKSITPIVLDDLDDILGQIVHSNNIVLATVYDVDYQDCEL